jgi:molecular chaperone DnaJ
LIVDLYAILGVRRSSTVGEIDRAYRRLARRFHPGVNPGDRVAEERFRQVDLAYRILSDAARRFDYDHGRAVDAPASGEDEDVTVSFEGFDFSAVADGPRAATFTELFADVFQDAARRATSPDRGVDISADLHVSFEQAVLGGPVPLSIVRQERCAACGGDGRTAIVPVPCPDCAGQGTLRSARGHMVFTKVCDRCEGRGVVTSQPCRMCRGAGVQPRGEVVTVMLPPGTESGARLSVPGRGHAGGREVATGDLYVTVRVAEHPWLHQVGRDLVVTLPVAVHEAALGARVDVPALTGPVALRIPPGSSSGQRLRLRGRGVPSAQGAESEAGDLIVQIQIVLPAVIDEPSKALLREFGRLNAEDVRRPLFERS